MINIEPREWAVRGMTPSRFRFSPRFRRIATHCHGDQLTLARRVVRISFIVSIDYEVSVCRRHLNKRDASRGVFIE